MDLCTQCGFAYPTVTADALPGRLIAFPPRYATALRAAPDPRRRPFPEVWSPLEYTCHVRDVFDVQRERLLLALREDAPEFVPMGRDERAVTYHSEDPDAVLAELTAAAASLAAAFAALRAAEWDRIGIYPWPERTERSMLWLGRHTVHEGVHHLLDIVSPSSPQSSSPAAPPAPSPQPSPALPSPASPSTPTPTPPSPPPPPSSSHGA